MAQLVVRNLDESVKDELQHRARRNGRSMEEEVRDILRQAVARKEEPSTGLGTRIARRFAAIGVEVAIPEHRGRLAKPPKLDD